MIPSQLQPLANHLWQSTLFAAVAGLLTLALSRNRAQIRHWLWLAASVKFLIPFSILVEIGSLLGRHTATAMAMTQSGLSTVIEQVSQPFAAPVPLPTIPTATQPSSASWIPATLYVVWAIGFVTLVFSWWLRWRSLRAALRTASRLHLPNMRVMTMEVMISPAFAEPGVFGICRPVLLLPAGITNSLTPPQLEAILAHELCHIRRRDNLATAIHMTVEAVFWFHPLVWWLGARLMDERERACDEEVLLLGSEPQVYAEGILKICELYLESPLPCVSGVTGANLKKRIETIMTNRIALRLNFAKKVALVTLGMSALAAPVIVGIINAPVIQAQSPQAAAESTTSTTTKFEVVSVKACNPEDMDHPTGKRGGSGGPVRWSPGRLDEECQTLADLIRDAYLAYPDGKPWVAGAVGVPATSQPEHFQCIGCGGGRGGLRAISARLFQQEIKGGPAWITSARYTIDAKAEGPARQELMRGPMLQALLEDRFKLKIHRESREIPVYELTVAKGGPKLQPYRDGSCPSPDSFDSATGKASGQPFTSMCGWFHAGKNGGTDVNGTTIANLCRLLSNVSDRDVIDKTGLAGMFDIHFDTHPAAPPANATPGLTDPAEPRPATAAEMALVESERFAQFQAALPKLGLKLEPAKGSGEFLVIDHLERPSGN
jgi:bla regulator protein BlaR1